jgi:hypothetical protein
MPFKYNALLGLGLDNTIPLDGAGKIPSTFLPSYVDDVEEYNNLAAFPATGETGKIYVAIDTGFAYRWSGSVYVQIGITAAAGATTQVQFNDAGAFGGDSGLTFDKTTDALSAGGFIPTSSTVPANGIYLPAANSVAAATNGTGRLFVDATGRVGIGATPTARLHLQTTSENAVLQMLENNGSTVYGASIDAFNSSGGNIRFRLHDSGGTFQERLRITSAGLVGVGTSAPNLPLTVAYSDTTAIPTSALADPATGAFQIANTSDSAAYAGIYLRTRTAGSTNALIGLRYNSTFSDGDIFFRVRNGAGTSVEPLTIKASGNVGIGTSAPDVVLDVRTGAAGFGQFVHASGLGGVRIAGTGQFSASSLVFANNHSAGVVDGYTIQLDGANQSLKFLSGGTAATARMTLLSDGKVGIGTSSPGALLDLRQPTSASEQEHLRIVGGQRSSDTFAAGVRILTGAVSSNINRHLRIINSGNTIFQHYETSSGNPAIDRNILLCPDGGRVGIGTTSPAVELEVSGPTNTQILINCQSDTGNSQLWFGDSSSDEAGVIIYRHVDNSMAFEVNDTEALRIDSSRRLLVGTSTGYGVASSGLARFQVGSSAADIHASLTDWSNLNQGGILAFGAARGGAVGNYTIVQDGDNLGSIRFAGADGTDLQSQGAVIAAQVDGTPGANDMPGRLVFSSTPSGSASPVERMRITNSGATYSLIDNSEGRALGTLSAASASNYFIQGVHGKSSIQSGGTRSFGVFTNGNVVNTNNSYGAISDLKLKENIVDAGSQWDDLKALQVRNYNFKEGQTHTQIGLVAQEVELVSPGLVGESPDRDEDGNDLGTVTKSVNYSVLYMKAVKALQEAMERIETLEARLTAAGIE